MQSIKSAIYIERCVSSIIAQNVLLELFFSVFIPLVVAMGLSGIWSRWVMDWVGHTLGGILATRGYLGSGVRGRRWVSM